MTIPRKEVIQVRVSEAEKADIRRRAAALGLDMSEYGRLRMLGDQPPTATVGARLTPKPPAPMTVVAVGHRLTEETQRGHLRVAPVGSLLKTKGTKR